MCNDWPTRTMEPSSYPWRLSLLSGWLALMIARRECGRKVSFGLVLVVVGRVVAA